VVAFSGKELGGYALVSFYFFRAGANNHLVGNFGRAGRHQFGNAFYFDQA
jgi:hypothetical protein